MEKLIKWKNQLVEEEKEISEILEAEYKFLMKVGALYPSFTDKNLPLTLYQFIIITVFTPIYMILLVYSCFLLRSDFELMFPNIHYLLLAMIGGAFPFHFAIKRKVFVSIHKKVKGGLFDYKEGRSSIHDACEKDEIQAKKVLAFFGVYIVITGLFIGALGPLIDYQTGTAYPYSHFNGVNMQVPINMYFPWDDTDLVGIILCLLFQMTTVGNMTLSIAATDLFVVTIFQKIASEFKILMHSLRTLHERARTLYNVKYQRDATSDDPKYQECLDYCLRQTLEHHKMIKTLYDETKDHFQFGFAIGILCGTGTIALSMVAATQGFTRPGTLATNVISVIAETINMYIVCGTVEEIITMGNQLNDEIYFMNWMNLNRNLKKKVMIMQDGTRRPWVFHMYGLIPCNMALFSQIMNTAFSYFNMMRASKKSS